MTANHKPKLNLRWNSACGLISLVMLCALLLPASSMADEGEIKQQLEQYLFLAGEAFPAQPELSPDRHIELRKQLDAFWYPQTASAKHRYFIEQNARYPYVLDDIQTDEDSASVVVSFTPESNPLDAAMLMYYATQGRYELEKHEGQWKLTGFNAIKQGQERAITAAASAQNVLFRHLEIMASIYLIGEKEPPRMKLIAARSMDRTLWKKDSTRPETVSLTSNPSAFFRIYQPSSWNITLMEETAAHARMQLSMAVGSDNQIRLHGGSFNRDVEYTLVQHQGSWHLTSFTDLTAQAEEELRRQEAEEAQAQEIQEPQKAP